MGFLRITEIVAFGASKIRLRMITFCVILYKTSFTFNIDVFVDLLAVYTS